MGGQCSASRPTTYLKITSYKETLAQLQESGTSYEEAAKLIVASLTHYAKKGDRIAARELCMMYVDGVGVNPDYETALMWLQKAGEDPRSASLEVAGLFALSCNQNNSDNKDNNDKDDIHAHRQPRYDEVKRLVAIEYAKMNVDGVGLPVDYRAALHILKQANVDQAWSQQLVAQRLQKLANKRNVNAAMQLAEMFVDYENSLTWLIGEGKDVKFFQERAAHWYGVAAEAGDTYAAEVLGKLYIEGQGVPIDFVEAARWLTISGRDKNYARDLVERKLETLKPKYKALYDAYASRGKGGEIDQIQFQGFYRDCLMAKGFSADKANKETSSLYAGKMKYETVFASYDRNGSRSLDFQEVWVHPHTHTTLFPKLGAHVSLALKFFEDWEANQRPLMALSSARKASAPMVMENSMSFNRSNSYNQDDNVNNQPKSARLTKSKSKSNATTAAASPESGVGRKTFATQAKRSQSAHIVRSPEDDEDMFV